MLAERILAWAQDFRAGELSAEDVQERFAALDLSAGELPERARQAVIRSQQTLDAIRYGMCDAGQRAEIARIFAELEVLFCAGKSSSASLSPDDEEVDIA